MHSSPSHCSRPAHAGPPRRPGEELAAVRRGEHAPKDPCRRAPRCGSQAPLPDHALRRHHAQKALTDCSATPRGRTFSSSFDGSSSFNGGHTNEGRPRPPPTRDDEVMAEQEGAGRGPRTPRIARFHSARPRGAHAGRAASACVRERASRRGAADAAPLRVRERALRRTAVPRRPSGVRTRPAARERPADPSGRARSANDPPIP